MWTCETSFPEWVVRLWKEKNRGAREVVQQPINSLLHNRVTSAGHLAEQQLYFENQYVLSSFKFCASYALILEVNRYSDYSVTGLGSNGIHVRWLGYKKGNCTPVEYRKKM